jgi:hypothetical protein
MTRHILSQIDLEHKTAFCTVCGYTEIHVPKNYQEGASRVYCAQRHKEQNRYKKMWAVLTPEERKLARKEKHTLKDIEPGSNRATCAICGPTDTYTYSHGGKTIHRCATFYRLTGRSESLQEFNQQPPRRDLISEIYQEKKAVKGPRLWSDLKQVNLGNLSRFNKPKPRVSYLAAASQKKKGRIDANTRLVHDYKRSHGCKRCGVQGLAPGKYRFFDLPLPPEQKIRRLVVKLDPEQLIVELEKHDLYCQNCHPYVLEHYHKRARSLRAAQILRSTLKSSQG